jgi:arsenate reductase
MLVAQRPDRAMLETLVEQLEDPVTDLVRRDANFKKLGLGDADVATAEQVVDVLVEHGELLQRPVLVRNGVAIIGRPKDRVAPFLAG